MSYIPVCAITVYAGLSGLQLKEVQWNLTNTATHGPGFIGRNNEVAGVQS